MNNIDIAKKHIQEADALFLTSGAGMSVDAGIPDYRSNTGVICQLKKKNYNYNKLTTPEFFFENPQNAWGWYIFQMQKYLNTKPHLGYYLIKNYIEKKKLDYFVYTSNLDTMWRRSGFSNNRVIEYHGSLDYLQSSSKNGPVWKVDLEKINKIKFNEKTFKISKSEIPISDYDKKYARPNICFFNDGNYFNTTIFNKKDKIFCDWYMNIAKKNMKLVTIEIGAGTIVPTIREKSEELFNDHAIRTSNEKSILIRINPNEFNVPKNPNAISIKMNGLEAIKKLFNQ